jgi:hypothetical protein
MYNPIFFALFPLFLLSIFSLLDADQGSFPYLFPKMKNNLLRVYVFASPRHIRKGTLKNLVDLINRTSTTVNVQLIDFNSKYYSLTDDERLIIETAISLFY